jgi:hypothetical protein
MDHLDVRRSLATPSIILLIRWRSSCRRRATSGRGASEVNFSVHSHVTGFRTVPSLHPLHSTAVHGAGRAGRMRASLMRRFRVLGLGRPATADLVFTHAEGGAYSPDSLSRVFSRLMEACNLFPCPASQSCIGADRRGPGRGVCKPAPRPRVRGDRLERIRASIYYEGRGGGRRDRGGDAWSPGAKPRLKTVRVPIGCQIWLLFFLSY